MEKDLPIGFFDSGVGGLSVFSRFRTLLPSEKVIYYGDLKNLPYGNKSVDELVSFASNILDFFEQKKVKAVVIACNTSSALAYEKIKDNYSFKIYPIIQSCASVIASLPAKRIGVFATEGTVKSGAYSNEIRRYNPNIEINEIACPNWVSIVEGRDKNTNDIKLKIDEMMKFHPDKIILGCTHYPYLLDTLTSFVSKDLFIDPAVIFTEYIYNDLKRLNLLNQSKTLGSESFYVSASPQLFVENSKLFYNVKVLPCLI